MFMTIVTFFITEADMAKLIKRLICQYIIYLGYQRRGFYSLD
jgi:hypothetical protein